MSARLSTAIRVAEAAKAILRKTRSFANRELEPCSELSEFGHVGVEPMLLALSMELALKAWFIFDYDDPKVAKTHNLSKLFDKLKPESQTLLDAEFKRSISPHDPNRFIINYGIRDVLFQHQDAFIDWRYLHEARKSMMFDQSAFEEVLEMVLREFDKRYNVRPTMQF